MNCQRCPHLKRIKDALKPCQLCEAGRLHGQVSVDAAPTASSVYRFAKPNDHRASDGVTQLSPEDEDSLRKAMSSLFGLEPVELLLLQHVIHGGSYGSFGREVLLPLYKRLRTKEPELDGRKPGFRSLAHTWAKKLAAKFPQVEAVLRARINFE